MLRFFFNRSSPVMKGFYALGALFSLLYFYLGYWQGLDALQKSLLGLFWLQVLFAQALVWYPFYPPQARGPGIKLQFQKALVPIAYIWPSFMLLIAWKTWTAFFVLFNLLLLPISAVACILLYFYWLDPERKNTNELTGQHSHS